MARKFVDYTLPSFFMKNTPGLNLSLEYEAALNSRNTKKGVFIVQKLKI